MAQNSPTAPASPEALVLKQLTKRYGQGEAVLSDLSWTFEPGTATGLVGPNGSGKTTLLRLLATLAFPTEGTVHYGELNIHERPYVFLHHVGLVYAEPELPAHLSAEELLTWILRERGRYDNHSEARIADLLDTVRLDERRTNLIGTYSSGMLQKTQVAAALVAQPQVLLMDEPFRGLDTESTAAVFDLLSRFTQDGGLVVVSSHDQSLVDDLCDALLDLRTLQPETVT
ncbi:MAG: ATP-binding cassette domain-containing protein [Bacteroidetes bacterium]|jgi:ABC-2 type transport system ATP-binding protein|nr:ATP-binding cassette domain-containing protein [Bacteroidota bacterium]